MYIILSIAHLNIFISRWTMNHSHSLHHILWYTTFIIQHVFFVILTIQCSTLSQQAQGEIEEHLKTAELLSLKGDTKGQKDQIINELVKVHHRFQARIHEYQILLKMTIQFFRNLDQVSRINICRGRYLGNLFINELLKVDRHLIARMQINRSGRWP